MESGYRYEYSLTDHLGNSRVMFSDRNNDGFIATDDPLTGDINESELLQEQHYYPFGMNMVGNFGAVQGAKNLYQYNGKELNEDFGLNWNDYGARWYDSAIGRWGQVDPLADHPNQLDKSPYAYAWNNPATLDDPDGQCPMCVGFAVGAVLDYGMQVGMNYYSGNSNPWTDVSVSSIMISGAAGATGVGLLSKAGNVLNGRTLQATEMAIDATVNMGTQYFKTGEIDAREVGVSVIAGQAVRTPAANSVKEGAKETGEKLSQNVTQAENILQTRINHTRKGMDAAKAEKRIAPAKQSLEKAKAAKAAHNASTRADAALVGGLSSGVTQKAFNNALPGSGPIYNFNDHQYVKAPKED